MKDRFNPADFVGQETTDFGNVWPQRAAAKWLNGAAPGRTDWQADSFLVKRIALIGGVRIVAFFLKKKPTIS